MPKVRNHYWFYHLGIDFTVRNHSKCEISHWFHQGGGLIYTNHEGKSIPSFLKFFNAIIFQRGRFSDRCKVFGLKWFQGWNNHSLGNSWSPEAAVHSLGICYVTMNPARRNTISQNRYKVFGLEWFLGWNEQIWHQHDNSCYEELLRHCQLLNQRYWAPERENQGNQRRERFPW